MKSFEAWYEDPDTGVDVFNQDLAKITAKQLKRVRPEDREKVRMVLQDHTSLYSPYTARLTDEELAK
jgi:hypothetical protein